MTTKWPLRLQAVLLLVLAGLFGGMGFVVLEHYYRANERALLDTGRMVQSVAWTSVQNQRHLLAEAVFREYVVDSRTLDLLRVAQDPAQRDRARELLHQRLEPAFQRLQDQGFEQFQFHLPSTESLLRMHHPGRFGDSLGEFRSGVAAVNRDLKIVRGFEIGRVVSGYRHIFPVIDLEGRHLGSVELSVPLWVLAQQLRDLMPGREFEVLLLAERVDAMIFPEQRSRYRPWQGSARYWVETPNPVVVDGLPTISTPIQELVASIAENPALRYLAEGDQELASRAWVAGEHYIIIRTPIVDSEGMVLGMVMSFAPEQAFAAIDQGFRLTVGLASLLFFSVLVGLILAFFAAVGKAADRRRLQVITDTLGEGLYVTDTRGVLTFVNPCAAELLGRTPEQLLGTVAHDEFHRHSRNAYLPIEQCPISITVQRGGAYRGEQQFQRSDGTILDVKVSSRPILHRDVFAGSVTVFQDISQEKADSLERERMQAELSRRTNELAQSNAELEQFAYAVSHDLRQPLRMISSYLELLQRRLASCLDGETQKMLDFAREAAIRLDQMLVSLLQYSRVGRLGEPMRKLDSRKVLTEALRFLEPRIHTTSAEVVIGGDWPEIYASRDEFTRLWQNLIDNALKYQKSGQTPRVELRAREQAGGTEFCVSDNGIGIDPSQFPRLFEVFQRLHTREEYEGAGVGLAICRKIVERHGGRIWVDSPGEGQGKGSQFCFWLPAAAGASQDGGGEIGDTGEVPLVSASLPQNNGNGRGTGDS